MKTSNTISKKLFAAVLAAVLGAAALSACSNDSNSLNVDTSDPEIAAAVQAEVTDPIHFTTSKNADGTLEIIEYSGTDKAIVIPTAIDGAAVTSIGYEAFRKNEYMESVVIPTGININSYPNERRGAFEECKNLKTVVVDSTEIGVYAFADSYHVEKLVLGNSVGRIGRRAFFYAGLLTDVDFNQVKVIEDKAFYHAFGEDYPVSITLPESVTEIGEEAFEHNTSLVSVTIENPALIIGERALGYNSSESIVEGFTIIAPAGSTAEQYANENGITFKPLTAN